MGGGEGGGAIVPAFQKDSFPSEGRDQPAKALPLGPEEQPNKRSQGKQRSKRKKDCANNQKQAYFEHSPLH